MGRCSNIAIAAMNNATIKAWPSDVRKAVIIISTEALRGDTGSAHPQEVHAGVKEAEDGAADSYGADVHGALEMTYDAGIDHAEQRYGDVGKNHRRGDAPDITVAGEAIGAHW